MKKSMSGTNCTAPEKRVLSFREICSIIKSCGESRVAELKFGDLHITFHQPVKEGLDAVKAPPQQVTTHPDAEISDEQRKHLEKHALLEDELRLKEDQLDQMLIESPTDFEELQAQGDLEEERDTGPVDDAETKNRRPESTL